MTDCTYDDVRRLLIANGADPVYAETQMNYLIRNPFVFPNDVMPYLKNQRAKKELNLRSDLYDAVG